MKSLAPSRELSVGILAISLLLMNNAPLYSAEWVRAGINVDKPLWGIKGGLQFAIHPASVSDNDDGGPRGLIRLGYPTLRQARYDLINFIADAGFAGNWSPLLIKN